MSKKLLDSLKMFPIMSYDCIGFDLDNTLAHYNFDQAAFLQYQGIKRSLINKGYSDSIFKWDIELATRGLFLDFDLECLIKVKNDCTILQAWRGRKSVSVSGKWNHGEQLMETGSLSDRAYAMADISDSATPVILVNLMENGYTLNRIWPDVLDSIIDIFSPDGFYTKSLIHETEKYVEYRPNLISKLKDLKKEKNLAMITGADEEVANAVAKAALGPEWKQLFNSIVYGAGKPFYFNRDTKCIWIRGKEMCGGNWKKQFSDWRNLKALYIGDNILHDGVGSSKAGLDCVLVLPELKFSPCFWGSFLHHNGIPTIWQFLADKYALCSYPSVLDVI